MTFDKLAAIEKTWDERRKEKASVNRIRIYGWREHGDDDDDSTEVAVFAAGAEDDMEALVRAEYGIGEGQGTIYCNSDMTIADGDILTSPDGRKLKISITEVHP